MQGKGYLIVNGGTVMGTPPPPPESSTPGVMCIDVGVMSHMSVLGNQRPMYGFSLALPPPLAPHMSADAYSKATSRFNAAVDEKLTALISTTKRMYCCLMFGMFSPMFVVFLPMIFILSTDSFNLALFLTTIFAATLLPFALVIALLCALRARSAAMVREADATVDDAVEQLKRDLAQAAPSCTVDIRTRVVTCMPVARGGRRRTVILNQSFGMHYIVIAVPGVAMPAASTSAVHGTAPGAVHGSVPAQAQAAPAVYPGAPAGAVYPGAPAGAVYPGSNAPAPGSTPYAGQPAYPQPAYTSPPAAYAGSAPPAVDPAQGYPGGVVSYQPPPGAGKA